MFEKDKCKMVVQVCELVNGDNKNREVSGLLEAMNYFKLKVGYIVTKKQNDKLVVDENLIQLIPATNFFELNEFAN